MTTYKDSGVDQELKDKCSAIMYEAAIKTFENRKGRFGKPETARADFTGPVYISELKDAYIVKNSDGVGSKPEITERMDKYDTIAFDLFAMVCDDAVTAGAEPFAVTNTLNVRHHDLRITEQLANGMLEAARVARVAVVGGEIAELGDQLTCSYTWDADVIGLVEMHKRLTLKRDIQVGDRIVGFQHIGFRCNGYTLLRKVLAETFGKEWHKQPYDRQHTWGEIALIPSQIYTPVIVDAVGAYKEPAKVKIKGVAHITSGGIPGNLPRILPPKLGASVSVKPYEPMLALQEMGNVPDREAYMVWNMGVGMLVITNDDAIFELAKLYGVKAFIAGEVIKEPRIEIENHAFFKDEATLVFPIDTPKS